MFWSSTLFLCLICIVFKFIYSFVNRNRYFGYNVTIPYKKTIFNYINKFENSCGDIGSTNCIFKGKGYNTDWKGFVLSLKKNNIDVSQKKCAIIGAGATAKSIAYALIELRCKSISIYNRTHENRILHRSKAPIRFI